MILKICFQKKSIIRLQINVIQILTLMLLVQGRIVLSHKSFVISFNSRSNGAVSPANNEWIEFTNEITSSKEFTACHWTKAKYFNKDIAINLWSYCTIENAGNAMKCIQTLFHSIKTSANRNVAAFGYIELEETKLANR